MGEAVGGRDRPRVVVHLDHGRSPGAWAALHERGAVLDPDPYGYGFARQRYEVVHSADRPERAIGRLLRRGLRYLLGFDVVHALSNRRLLATADVVWTHTEHEHLAIGLLKRARLLGPVPVVAQTVWLWDSWPRLRGWRRACYRWLLETHDVHTTHSSDNAAAASALGFAAVVVPFGIEPANLQHAVERRQAGPETRVVAPGSDRHRDWRTLRDACALSSSLAVRVLSRRAAASALQSPGVPNFVVERGADARAVRAAYEWADVVVVPLRPNGHASGLTVCLEGVLSSRPVVATDTGGLRDYFPTAVRFVPAGDAAALAAALEAAARDSAGPGAEERQRLVHTRGLTADDYAWRHVLLTEALLAGRPVGESGASAFSAVADGVRRG